MIADKEIKQAFILRYSRYVFPLRTFLFVITVLIIFLFYTPAKIIDFVSFYFEKGHPGDAWGIIFYMTLFAAYLMHFPFFVIRFYRQRRKIREIMQTEGTIILYKDTGFGLNTVDEKKRLRLIMINEHDILSENMKEYITPDVRGVARFNPNIHNEFFKLEAERISLIADELDHQAEEIRLNAADYRDTYEFYKKPS